MSITAPVPGPAPAGVLAETLVAVRGLAATLWSARSDAELVEVVGRVQQLTSALAAVEAGAVAEADARDLAKQRLHYGSTGDWLTHTGGLRRGQGKRRVVRARALTGPLARTLRGLVDGTVSPVQADLIVSAVEDLPSGELVRARGEKVLVHQAAHLDASDLARAGRHLAEVVDPETTDRRLEAALAREERAAHHGRYLSISTDPAGGVRLRGRGSAEDGAHLLATLLPLTTPTPATRAATDPDTDPSREAGEEHLDPRAARDTRDARDHGARLWDALITTAQHALNTALPPETHATPARLLITLDHHTLITDLEARGLGTTADGTDLPPDALRRLACDAEIIPAVLGSHREVLDLGRLRRLVTPTLWTALVIRDRHCTFPTCNRPPLMCQAHHLTHWGRRRHHHPRQPHPPVRATTTAHPGKYASTPPTDNPNSNHHPPSEPPPNGFDIETDENRYGPLPRVFVESTSCRRTALEPRHAHFPHSFNAERRRL